MSKVNLGRVVGDDGRGIEKIEKTSTDGLIDTYTITYTDRTTSTYTVKNGKDGVNGSGSGSISDITNGFEGKILSILGDSISTFSGYIPIADGYNLTHRARYPQSNLLTDVADTWWYRLMTNLNMKLGINDSWAGSRVSNSSTTNSGDVGPKAHMASMTRISNLGANGNPDLILFYGGTNDLGTNVTLGSFDSTETHTTIDLESETYSDFATAYKIAIQRLMYMYPKARIVVLLPMVTTSYYSLGNLDKYLEIIKNICDYFGVYYIDLRRCGINWFNKGDYLPDGIHPNAKGMELMERHIRQQLLSIYSVEEGEITTYNVTNNLTGIISDKIYVKATRSGEKYTANLTVEDENSVISDITVTMNGVDVTSSSYNDGNITISNVTGDIVITAVADGIVLKEYTVTNNLTNATNSNTSTKVVENGTYTAEITANRNYIIDTVTVTMGGIDVTSTVYSNGTITIEEVIGDIIITVTTIESQRTTANSHAQIIPSEATAETNLVEAIGLVNEYYNGSIWSTTISGGNLKAYSLTIPVIEGDQIYANSFGASSTNGSSYGVNGIRVTYFNDDTVVSSIKPADIYSEFSSKGYITVPSGVNAVCIPVWTPNNQVIKLLTL